MGKSDKNRYDKSSKKKSPIDLLDMLPTPRLKRSIDLLYPMLPTPTNRPFPSPKSSDKTERIPKRNDKTDKSTKPSKKKSTSKNKKDQPTLRV